MEMLLNSFHLNGHTLEFHLLLNLNYFFLTFYCSASLASNPLCYKH